MQRTLIAKVVFGICPSDTAEQLNNGVPRRPADQSVGTQQQGAQNWSKGLYRDLSWFACSPACRVVESRSGLVLNESAVGDEPPYDWH